MRYSIALLALALLGSGCSFVHGVGAPEHHAQSLSNWDDITADASGVASRGKQILHLPRARETRRFGITVVDGSRLPRAWRPPHAKDGGILVSAIEPRSRLLAAGVGPGDLIEELNGAPVTDVDDFVRRLEDVRDGETLELVFRSRFADVSTYGFLDDGPSWHTVPVAGKPSHYRVTVQAPSTIDADTWFWLPFLVDVDHCDHGTGLTVGPFASLAYYKHDWTPQEYTGGAGESRSLYLLFGLVRYRTASTTAGPSAKLTLFWFVEIGV